MGDLNQLKFIRENANLGTSPILEIGSKNYGNTPNLRGNYTNFEYVGIDLENGDGVDIVLDLTDDFNIIEKKLGNMKFNTIICFSVLEHCKNPFRMCQNISQLLKKKESSLSAPHSLGEFIVIPLIIGDLQQKELKISFQILNSILVEVISLPVKSARLLL